MSVFIVLAALTATACAGVATPTIGPGSFGTPGPTGPATLTPTATPDATATTAPSDPATPSDTVQPTSATVGCSGSDKNRAFFAEAAASMPWPVYCAVLPAGWFLVSGTYRLAGGGELEVAYNGPGEATLAMVEGNACDQYGSDIDACAPRDNVIGQANLADQSGELGQLSNALVLDVDRGANPTWRVTGLALSEADFRAICAAMLRVGAPG